MDPRAGKKTRASSKAGAAAAKVSAQAVSDAALSELNDSPAARRAPLPPAGSCAPAREKGPKGRAPRACAQKAAPRAEAAAPPAAAAAVRVPTQVLPAERPEPPEAAAPPASRAGSRRKAGERSAREQSPPSGSHEALRPGASVQTPGLSRSEVAPGGWKPQKVLERLKLKRQEISEAAAIVNSVVGRLLQRLQNLEWEFKDVALLHTGSYYERVKISAPDEFDVMFKLEVPRIQLEEYCNSGAHYFVKFKRNPKGSPLNQFLENELLSASKMLSKFRKIIMEEIKSIEDTDVAVERKRRGSPAVTLIIKKPREISVDIILALESNSSWPASTVEGLPIKPWLGSDARKRLRQMPFYLVPKHAKEGNGFQEETWRLSFSHIEKEILNKHGQKKTCCQSEEQKCCRKSCLKLMKYLLEQLKKKFESRRLGPDRAMIPEMEWMSQALLRVEPVDSEDLVEVTVHGRPRVQNRVKSILLSLASWHRERRAGRAEKMKHLEEFLKTRSSGPDAPLHLDT
ncbi:cyclic GMP-AMP synthase [Lepus europaeus]|uniref:cyclic GMP-AMP synthase n=1 Tax=Lepus europaeus TaxID=9983 RepID=UPI002B49FD06|nr:cyclic GMP-AMP synthase [Lepus europaeus]